MLGTVLVSLAAGLLGAIVGRWWAVAAPLLVWPLFFLGLGQGWWGSGLGETWGLALGLLMVLGVAAAAAGVLVRKLEPWTRRTSGTHRA